jgi:hypothetical protein
MANPIADVPGMVRSTVPVVVVFRIERVVFWSFPIQRELGVVSASTLVAHTSIPTNMLAYTDARNCLILAPPPSGWLFQKVSLRRVAR